MSATKAKLGIWLPTYKRPHKVQEVATNIEQTTKTPYKLYFGCEPEDLESIEACRATGHEVIINKYSGGYSNTIQTIYEQTKEPVAFHANDDFLFLNGWDVPAMEYFKKHPEIMMLGAHDGTSHPSYSTIQFVRRKYIEEQSGVVDIPNRVFYPYNHNYQDTEFTRTAVMRGVWAKLENPCIEHRRFGHDETYEKNNATFSLDGDIYNGRKHLFGG